MRLMLLVFFTSTLLWTSAWAQNPSACEQIMITETPDVALTSFDGSHAFEFEAQSQWGQVGAVVDRGHSKRTSNQDSIAFFDNSEQTVLLVSDGAGGMQGGDRVSYLITHKVLEDLKNKVNIAHSLSSMDNYLEEQHLQDPEKFPRRMGAAAVAVLIKDSSVQFMHKGDARGVLLRGPELRVFHETQDHREGTATLTRYFSPMGGRELSTSSPLGIARNDWVVIASDGVWDVLTLGEIKEVLKKNLSPFQATIELRQLIDHKNAQSYIKDDNVSLVIYRHHGQKNE